MERIAVFPGSFDPMTIGHLALLRRAVPLFDKIIVAVGVNHKKGRYIDASECVKRIRRATARMKTVEVATYTSLTTDFCRERGARFILRGIRTEADYLYESTIADINRLLDPDIETVLMMSEPRYATISSSMVRELMYFGKDVSKFIA